MGGVPELGCQEKLRWVSASLGGLRSGDSPGSERCPRRGVGRNTASVRSLHGPPELALHIPTALFFTPGTQSGSALMGELWALVCRLPGQLLKIWAWGQARGWREEQDNTAPPPPRSRQFCGVINASQCWGQRHWVLGKFERGAATPRGRVNLLEEMLAGSWKSLFTR